MRFEFSTFSLPQIITALALLGLSMLALLVMPKVNAASSSEERLITIHDRGTERGLITEADTLREVFDEARITLDKNDIVEPAIDEKLVTNNYQVNIYRARPIVIVDGAVQQLVMSAYQTPKQIASHAGIVLQDEDTAEIELTNSLIRDGASSRMVIDRAIAVRLKLYGSKIKTVYTQAATVNGFMKEKNISLQAKDTVSVGTDRSIKTGMLIEIWRNGKQTVTDEEKIDYPVEQIKDTDREVGYKKVKTPGTKGTKMVTYEIVMKNGKEVSRKAIQTVVTKKPSKQVEVVGTKMANSFDGDFAAALAKLRSCEGSYSSNTGNGYYGAYQYDIQTWGNFKGYANAAQAPPKVQDERAWQTYKARGWSPWPSCRISQGLQDIYR